MRPTGYRMQSPRWETNSSYPVTIRIIVLAKKLNSENIYDVVKSLTHTKDYAARSRKPQYVDCRKKAMYISKLLTNESLEVIGKTFDRDHSTVLYNCNTVEGYIDTNPKYAKKFNELLVKVKKYFNYGY